MKIRNDFVTNSSSSSYVIATPYKWNEFVEKELPKIIYERYKEYEFNKLLELFENRAEIDRDNAKELLINHFSSIFWEYDKNYNEARQEATEKSKIFINKKFDKLNNDYHFYELGSFEDCGGLLEQRLDQNEVFKEDTHETKVFYLNHH